MSEPLGRLPVRAYVGLGANLGDALATLQSACEHLAALPLTTLVATSRWLASRPIDAAGPDFINGACALDTGLTAPQLLAGLQGIELAFGRQRPYRNAPRTLDLDLLLYGSARIESPDLLVPHPRTHRRAFALMPLADLDPALVLPGQGPVADLLAALPPQGVRWLDDAAATDPHRP